MAPRKAFPLRINPELYKELEGWAQEEFRSVNGQIEFLLRLAVLRRKGTQKIADGAAQEPSPSEEAGS